MPAVNTHDQGGAGEARSPAAGIATHQGALDGAIEVEDHSFHLALVEMDHHPRIAADERLPAGTAGFPCAMGDVVVGSTAR